MLITSDQHFFHKNIIQYENRPFLTKEEMNESMIKDWNSVVHKRDYIYVLGDLAFGNKEMIKNLISRLNGRIHLIMGNHDGKRSYKWWLECGIEWVSKYPILYENNYILSHTHLDGFFRIRQAIAKITRLLDSLRPFERESHKRVDLTLNQCLNGIIICTLNFGVCEQ